jgi:hypothetical protein
MKAMILFLLVSSLNMCMSCCSKIFPDAKLSMQRKDYNGNELRIDGYYFREDNTSSRMIIYLLYNNGVLLYGGAPLISEIEKRKQEFASGEWHNTRKNDKAAWGIFCIDGKNIRIEKWEPSTGIGLPVYIREGNILNDTTIHITIGYSSDGSDRRKLNEVYHFREFSPKPDSTNVYIK